MILRLLKSLRITARRHIQATSLDVRNFNAESATARAQSAAVCPRSLKVATTWKTWTVCSVAAIAISTTSSVQAQQFQQPRLPRGYEYQTSYANQTVQANSRRSAPEFQQPVAPAMAYRVPASQSAVQSPRSYAPPVHISPGTPNSLRANQETNSRTSGAVVSLNDRSLSLNRNPVAGSPTPAVGSVSTNHYEYGRVSQAVNVQARRDHHPSVRRQRLVGQTSMQQPFQDPFGDEGFNGPDLGAPELVPQRSGSFDSRQNAFVSETRARQIPPTMLPRSSQPLPKQVSILSGSDQGSEGGQGFEVFDSSQKSNGDSNFRQEPTLDLERSSSQSFDQSATSHTRQQSQSGGWDEVNDDDLRQNLEDRLNNLMEETKNDLRSQKSDDEEDSFEEMTPNRGTRSLLDLDEQDSDDGDDEQNRTPLDKSCDEFRNRLLDNPIRDIALDMIPPTSENREQFSAIGRSWTDRSGNVIATGSMTDLRRSYVVLDNGQRIAFHRLSEADMAAVADFWQVPVTCSHGDRGSVCRNWVPQTYTWTATSLCHKPLYFENIQLERYGHSHGPFEQPIKSVGHFFISLVTVPYQSALHPANECQYALGFYRPGDCAPWLKDPIPISLAGAVRETLVVGGLAAIP